MVLKFYFIEVIILSLTRKINLISNRNFESRKTSLELIEKFTARGFQISERYSPDAELNICVGGDGRFLRAVHKYKFPSIPFIGINTGHLGFFQEISPENIDVFISKYINQDYYTEDIYLIDAKVVTSKKTYQLTAINEIVVKSIQSKVIHLDLYIDGNHLEKFSGDGLIISSPVGSTAYNLSTGGSIVYPSLKTVQITPLSPINSKAYRSLPNSMVVPGNLEICVRPERRYINSALIVNDGVEFKYQDTKEVILKLSENKIFKLNFDQDNYWNNLKSKFL